LAAFLSSVFAQQEVFAAAGDGIGQSDNNVLALAPVGGNGTRSGHAVNPLARKIPR